jgi:hypothetical protein
MLQSGAEKMKVRILLTIASVLFSATADASEEECKAARIQAAGKYSACQAKVLSRSWKKEDVRSDETLRTRAATCRERYVALWPELQAKYPGTTCAGPRFVDQGGSIVDNLTFLTWEKKSFPDGMEGPGRDVDNIEPCANFPDEDPVGPLFQHIDSMNDIDYEDRTDWRLPTSSELQTILLPETVPCTTNPCVDPLFLPSQSGVYWTSSPSLLEGDDSLSYNRWAVNMGTGELEVASVWESLPFRAVTGGL